VDAASPSSGGDPGEVQAMKAKLQRAKRTLDNMKKREADALQARDDALAQLESLRLQPPSQVTASPWTGPTRLRCHWITMSWLEAVCVLLV
jgi:hypothetical protein